MKKKNRKKIRECIVIISLVGLYFLVIFIILPQIQEPHFKIYKAECRNETLFNYEGIFYDIYEFDEIIWENWENNWNRYYDLGCDVLSKHGVINASKPCELLVRDIENYNKMEKGLVDYFLDGIIDKSLFNTKTEEVCEPVEVDEIDGDTVFCLGTPETNFDWCKKNMKGHYYLYKDIERLDIRWLNEYCECIECYDERDINEGEQLNPTYCNEDKREWTFCKKYSCGEKYIVEVLN